MAARRNPSPYSLLFLAAVGAAVSPPAPDAIDPSALVTITTDHDQQKKRRRRVRRYALLMAAHDSDYVKERYGGYYGVFKSAFADDPADVWDVYRVIDGEFPRQDDLGLYDGFVISGSPSDAHGQEPWVLQLCALVKVLYRTGKRVLGVCFGHQVICCALGGEVRRARKGWDIGVTEVKLENTITAAAAATTNNQGCWFLEAEGLSSGVPTSAPIIEVHQDEVWEVPPGAEVIARSERTGVEMFHVGGRVLGIQGHPEYSKDILANIIDRLVGNGVIREKLGQEAKNRLAAGEPDRQFWLRVCRSFLKGPQPPRPDTTAKEDEEVQPTTVPVMSRR